MNRIIIFNYICGRRRATHLRIKVGKDSDIRNRISASTFAEKRLVQHHIFFFLGGKMEKSGTDNAQP